MSAASCSEENKDLIRRWFEQVWNQGRADLIAEFRSHDTVATGLAGEPVAGNSPFATFHANLREAFPDLRIEIDDIVAEGDKVAARITARGTHLGKVLGLAATERTVVFSGMVMARIADGKIAEAWNSLDQLGLLRQIGALPADAPREDFLLTRR